MRVIESMDYSALTEAANATSVYRARYQTIAKEIVAGKSCFDVDLDIEFDQDFMEAAGNGSLMDFVESYGQLNQLSGDRHAEIIKTLQDWFDASWDFASDTESWICDQEGEDSFSEDTVGYALACAFIYWYSKEGYYEVDLLKHDSPRIRLIQASYANEDQKEEYRSWGLPYDPYVDPYLED